MLLINRQNTELISSGKSELVSVEDGSSKWRLSFASLTSAILDQIIALIYDNTQMQYKQSSY